MTRTNDPAAIARQLRRYAPLAKVVSDIGPPPVQRRAAPDTRYAYLVRSIVHQQLAGAAAAAIHGRLVAACDGVVTPEVVTSLSVDTMASLGLSGAKRAAIGDLTIKVKSGEIALEKHARLSDDAVIAEMVQVRGIGVWTSQMYLMGPLGRTDVWPTGDLGVRQGWTMLHDLDPLISSQEIHDAANSLAPHRSAVAWYCWQVVNRSRRKTN